MKFTFFLSFFFLSISCLEAQQQKTRDTVESKVNFDCDILQTKQKMEHQFFASTAPISFRINNKEYVYANFQFGKRKDKIFMYIRIADKNVCIEKDKVLDIYFKSGEVVSFKNDFALNCEGYFAKELTKKEYLKLQENEISLMKIYAYQRNYEWYVSEVQNLEISHQLDCLAVYKVKKSEEIKLKKNMKKEKNEPDSGT